MLALIAKRVILTHEILSNVSSTSGGPRKRNIYCNKARLTYLTRQSSHDKYYTTCKGIKVIILVLWTFVALIKVGILKINTVEKLKINTTVNHSSHKRPWVPKTW